MNSRVDPDVICAPLSETASSTGWASAAAGSPTVSVSARISSSSPSASSARVKSAWTWIEVASAQSIVSIHLRDTRSRIASALVPAAVNAVKS